MMGLCSGFFKGNAFETTGNSHAWPQGLDYCFSLLE